MFRSWLYLQFWRGSHPTCWIVLTFRCQNALSDLYRSNGLLQPQFSRLSILLSTCGCILGNHPRTITLGRSNCAPELVSGHPKISNVFPARNRGRRQIEETIRTGTFRSRLLRPWSELKSAGSLTAMSRCHVNESIFRARACLRLPFSAPASKKLVCFAYLGIVYLSGPFIHVGSEFREGRSNLEAESLQQDGVASDGGRYCVFSHL